jgi:hypothetical protein
MPFLSRARVAIALVGVAACGGQVAVLSSDAGSTAAPTPEPSGSPVGSVPTPIPPPPIVDAGEIPPPPPVCHGCVDAGHDAGHDAGPPDAGPVIQGDAGCPSNCVLEPTGVPPCTAPLRTCDCKGSTLVAPACKPVPGATGLSCCAY